MNKKELEKLISIEIDFLRYYGLREDRYKLDDNSDIYKDIRSIGYCKRNLPLTKRCIPETIKCDSIINEETQIDDLYIVSELKSDNNFSPCEIFMKIFPNRKNEIINLIKSEISNISTKITI